MTPDGLSFVNLSARYGFAGPETNLAVAAPLGMRSNPYAGTYRVRWSVYDNASDSTRPLGDTREQTETTVALPRVAEITTGSDLFLLAEIHAVHDQHPMWNRRVGVYLRPVGESFEVVGVERESDPPDTEM